MISKKVLREKFPIVFRWFSGFRAEWYKLRYIYATKTKANRGFEELLKKDYHKFTGLELHFPPRTYSEKIQWSKIYDSTKEKGILSDKFAVRKWVKEKIGEEYLVPLLGVWDTFDEINFEELDTSFVLKATHGSGTNIVVPDKKCFDKKAAKKDFDFWLKQDFSFFGCGYEMHYQYVQPKIIAEKFLNPLSGTLNDYKFLCFNGKVHYCWVDTDRETNHKRNVYDLEWNLQPWTQFTYGNAERTIEKPQNFKKMVEIAECLAQGFDHVRVDLFDVDGKIYFGEMTFTNGKGYEIVEPREYDAFLGELWQMNGNKM